MPDESMVIKRKPLIPCPEGKHGLVLVDWYSMLAVETQFGKKDFLYLVWQADPETAGRKETELDDGRIVSLPYLVMARYTAQFKFKRNEDGKYVSKDGRVLEDDPPKSDDPKVKPKLPEDYAERVVTGLRVPGERANLHKALKGLYGEDLGRAYNEGLDFEKMVQVKKQAQGWVKHGEPDKNGNVWANLIDLSPPLQGQKVEPEGYVRKRTRDEDEEVPF